MTFEVIKIFDSDALRYIKLVFIPFTLLINAWLECQGQKEKEEKLKVKELTTKKIKDLVSWESKKKISYQNQVLKQHLLLGTNATDNILTFENERSIKGKIDWALTNFCNWCLYWNIFDVGPLNLISSHSYGASKMKTYNLQPIWYRLQSECVKRGLLKVLDVWRILCIAFNSISIGWEDVSSIKRIIQDWMTLWKTC